ncbi:MAG TPA: TIM barrel protein [Gemmatimonadaceae bacterium]|nr:TIM barrel protein [Gemmatimonadaceae bacterium]
MHRRTFLTSLGIAAAAARLGACVTSPARATSGAAPSAATGGRRLKRVGIQLYTLRDDARGNLEGTLAAIAAAGYKDVELLSSMKNFGMPATQLRQTLDRLGLRAPSTHIGANAFDNLDALFDEANTLGHEYVVLASLPFRPGESTPDDYRRWADRLNDAGRQARPRNLWVAFHDEAYDFRTVEGQQLYDILADRTDPSLVRLQLDTGNAAMGGRDPLDLMRKYGSRYYSFHIKDAPRLGASTDAELGAGVVDFRRILGMISDIDNKYLFVEQETYPGAPLDSVKRDYQYISTLEF